MLACAIRLEPGPYDFFMTFGSPGTAVDASGADRFIDIRRWWRLVADGVPQAL